MGLFQEALHLFANLIRDPQFDEEVVEREVSAIESEFQIDRKNDEWRLRQLERHLAQPGHHFTRCTAGNHHSLIGAAETLAELTECLSTFSKQNYSPNGMAIAVLGKQTLQVLEDMVRLAFDG